MNLNRFHHLHRDFTEPDTFLLFVGIVIRDPFRPIFVFRYTSHNFLIPEGGENHSPTSYPNFATDVWDCPNLCRKLSISSDIVPSLQYNPFVKDLLEKLCINPHIYIDRSQIERWVIEAEPLYDLFEKSILKRTFCAVHVGGDGVSPVSLTSVCSFPIVIAKCFSLRADFRLKRGCTESAWADILYIFHLARHFQNVSLTFSQTLGFIIEGVANARDQHVLESGRLSVSMLRKCLNDLQSLSITASFEDIIQCERLECLNDLLQMPRYGFDTSVFSDLKPLLSEGTLEEHKVVDDVVRSIPLDWNIILQTCNEVFDQMLMLPNNYSTRPFQNEIDARHFLS